MLGTFFMKQVYNIKFIVTTHDVQTNLEMNLQMIKWHNAVDVQCEGTS